MALESVPAYSGFRTGRAGQAYNEAAFRHFLAVERRRAERSTGSLLLVLVTLRRGLGRSAKLSDATAGALFLGLGACVREVDFVGWLREGRVAAAVLTQRVNAANELSDRIAERMLEVLRKRLPGDESVHMRVRVVPLGRKVRK